ncbi:phosphoglycolate phosphatase [Halomonas shantousis]
MHSILDDVRLVTFDLDGTLIDSVPDLAVAIDTMLEELGLNRAGEDAVRDWVGNGSHKLVERALRSSLNEEPGSDRVNAAHERFLHHYRDVLSRFSAPFPGVREGLEGLHRQGLTLTVVTNKPQAFIAPILESFSLTGYFSLTLGGDALPQKKPDPAPLLHVAERFGVPPRACLMVGDSRHDVEAGRRAGFRTLAVPYGYNHGEPVATSRPDAMVESLVELL